MGVSSFLIIPFCLAMLFIFSGAFVTLYQSVPHVYRLVVHSMCTLSVLPIIPRQKVSVKEYLRGLRVGAQCTYFA